MIFRTRKKNGCWIGGFIEHSKKPQIFEFVKFWKSKNKI